MSHLEPLAAALRQACKEVYGERLVALAVFGSTGRNTAGPDSDVDLLLVADLHPDGRMRRVDEFQAIETRVARAAPVRASSRADAISSVQDAWRSQAREPSFS